MGNTVPIKRNARSVHGVYSGIAEVAVGLGWFESVGVAVAVGVVCGVSVGVTGVCDTVGVAGVLAISP